MSQNPERLAAAKRVPLLEWLQAKGYGLTREGTYYRLTDNHAIVIDSSRNAWYDNRDSTRAAHDPIDWLTQMEGLPFGQAIAALLAFSGEAIEAGPLAAEKKPANSCNRPFSSLLETHPLDNFCWAYLTKQRQLPQEVIKAWEAAGLLGSAQVSGRSNLVWTSKDQNGHPRGQIVRGTLSQVKFTSGRGPKDWPVIRSIGTPKRAIIFEAPIDAMSFEALYKPQNRLLAAMGGLIPSHVARVMAALQLPQEAISIAVDNDPAGDDFWATVQQTWPQARRILPPSGKDWNEYLCGLGGAAPLLPEVKEKRFPTS